MKYTEIESALESAIASVAVTHPEIPEIKSENTISTAKAGTPFTRTTFLPARPNRLTVGVDGKDELIGYMQIDLYYPTGTGTSSASIAADALVDAFPRNWSVSVSDGVLRVPNSWREAGRTVNNWYCVSVMLNWSAVR